MDNDEKKDLLENQASQIEDESSVGTEDLKETNEIFENESFEVNPPQEKAEETTFQPQPISSQPPYQGQFQYGYPTQQMPQSPQPMTPPPQSPSQQMPQAQWSFNDYGPLGGGQPIPPKPKKEKKPRSQGFGMKIFAIVMSVLFVASVCGFSIYIFNGDDTSPISPDTATSESEDNKAPSLNISNTPDKPSGDENGDGTLSTKEIYNKISPSVVGIAVYVKQYGEVIEGEGSGVVMDKDGYIVTNYHVVAGDMVNPVVKIEVIMPSGDTYIADLIGGDSKTDLAVIKINAPNLVPAEFGDSDKLSIGDRVAVIGNPSGIQFAGSLTQGVVSALNRNVYMSDLQTEMQYIQTDAAINPGNSGGAFINEYGQVVGISAAKMRSEAGYEGMGFAIPINNAKSVIDSLIKNGYVTGRPMIGITYKAMSPTLAELNGIPAGLRVLTVDESFDAFKKGISPGDIITKINGVEVFDGQTVGEALKGKNPGEELVLTVYRVNDAGRSSTLEVKVVLGEDVRGKPTE